MIQNDKPITFYSRKLAQPQQRCTVTEKEFLSIVETLNKFRTVLLGQCINIYTDHKNIPCKKFNTDRVLQWRLISEEYGSDIEYIPGAKNIAADALSRLTNDGNQETTHESTYTTESFSELYDIKEQPEGTFPLYFKLI